ncbi:hydrolase [Bacillus sp. REN3]|uniref:hydrolase n=1 Tax=Bacillus sp. REN3 TaxID=2802440 RepID=UPI001AEE5F15|nr:hydrolase [Bacillus sp. REN3]
MANDKKTYYINVSDGEISTVSTASPWNFKIEATDEEITDLREIFEQAYSTGWQNFMRAHVPYIQYHYDRENDALDRLLVQVYEQIYQLGDEEAKQHIESMGILPGK